jgi:hypothetical protein
VPQFLTFKVLHSLIFNWDSSDEIHILSSPIACPLASYPLLLKNIDDFPGTLPLAYNFDCTFYNVRTGRRDRFATSLDQRFSCRRIEAMMRDAGLEIIRFSQAEPTG